MTRDIELLEHIGELLPASHYDVQIALRGKADHLRFDDHPRPASRSLVTPTEPLRIPSFLRLVLPELIGLAIVGIVALGMLVAALGVGDDDGAIVMGLAFTSALMAICFIAVAARMRS